MLVKDVPTDKDALARLEKSWVHIDGGVFAQEDLYIAESIQSTMNSGADDHLLLGGMEEGMRLFHEARDAALREG